MRRQKFARVGSVSTGTLDPEELAETFAWELQSLYRSTARPLPPVVRNLLDVDVQDVVEEDDLEGYLEALQEALNEFAPPFAYFGTHPGDGADFGFWVSEDSVQDAVYDGEIAVVQDDSHGGRSDDIPRGFTGYVLHVSDHGNQSLYRYVRGRNLGDQW